MRNIIRRRLLVLVNRINPEILDLTTHCNVNNNLEQMSIVIRLIMYYNLFKLMAGHTPVMNICLFYRGLVIKVDGKSCVVYVVFPVAGFCIPNPHIEYI